MDPTPLEHSRRGERRPLETKVEFFVDADIIEATSVDISESGIRFDTKTPVRICMRLTVDGELQEKRARLIWAKKLPEGGVTYGFEFLPPEEELPPPPPPPPGEGWGGV